LPGTNALKLRDEESHPPDGELTEIPIAMKTMLIALALGVVLSVWNSLPVQAERLAATRASRAQRQAQLDNKIFESLKQYQSACFKGVKQVVVQVIVATDEIAITQADVMAKLESEIRAIGLVPTTHASADGTPPTLMLTLSATKMGNYVDYDIALEYFDRVTVVRNNTRQSGRLWAIERYGMDVDTGTASVAVTNHVQRYINYFKSCYLIANPPKGP
jgi:hypothetical protein